DASASAAGDVHFTPRVAVDTAGNTVVAWMTPSPVDPTHYTVVAARRYDSNGTLLNDYGPVNTAPADGTPWEADTPTVAMRPSGAFAIGWRRTYTVSGTTPTQADGQLFDASGNRFGPNLIVFSVANDASCSPVPAVFPVAGGLAIAWDQNTGVFA